MKRFVPIILCVMGCQPDPGDLDRIEAQLKDDPTRGGKVGTQIGLSVRKHAISHAKDILRPVHDCGLAEGPRRTEVSVTVSRSDKVLQAWKETRWYNADSAALRVDFQFVENGTSSPEHRLLWQKYENAWLTRTDLDDRWFSRRATPQDIEFLRQNGLGVGQTLLNAASGWSAQSGSWGLGGVKVVCERGIDESTGWLQRFGGRVQVRSGSMSLEGDRRREIDVSWTLSDGTILAASVVEQVVDWQPELPVDILATTSRNTIDERLRAWQKLGWIALRSNDD
ncbi:MAG: hypothetical protein R3E66_19685 [bacterium]